MQYYYTILNALVNFKIIIYNIYKKNNIYSNTSNTIIILYIIFTRTYNIVGIDNIHY